MAVKAETEAAAGAGRHLERGTMSLAADWTRSSGRAGFRRGQDPPVASSKIGKRGAGVSALLGLRRAFSRGKTGRNNRPTRLWESLLLVTQVQQGCRALRRPSWWRVDDPNLGTLPRPRQIHLFRHRSPTHRDADNPGEPSRHEETKWPGPHHTASPERQGHPAPPSRLPITSPP